MKNSTSRNLMNNSLSRNSMNNSLRRNLNEKLTQEEFKGKLISRHSKESSEILMDNSLSSNSMENSLRRELIGNITLGKLSLLGLQWKSQSVVTHWQLFNRWDWKVDKWKDTYFDMWSHFLITRRTVLKETRYLYHDLRILNCTIGRKLKMCPNCPIFRKWRVFFFFFI